MNPPTISTAQIEEMLSHREWLTKLAYRLVRNRSDADDLVQTAFERSLRRPPGRPEAMRAWLAQILRNLASNHRRNLGLAAQRTQTQADHLRAAGELEVDQVAEAAQKVEIERLMLNEVMRLPDAHRDPLLLRFERELSFDQIGKELGITEEAARKRVSRAVNELRDLVAQRLGSGWRDAMGLAFGLSLPAPRSLATAAAAVAAVALVSGAAWYLMKPEAAPEGGLLALAPVEGTPDPDLRPETELVPASAEVAAAPEILLDEGARTALEVPVAPELPDPWHWTGLVTDLSGRPVPGASIVASSSKVLAVFPVPAGGAYSIQLDPSWNPQRTSLFVLAPDLGVGRRVSLSEQAVGAALDLQLERGVGYQEIQIVDLDDRPVPGVAVWVEQGARASNRITDASGIAGFLLPDDRNFTVTVFWRGLGRDVSRVGEGEVLIHAQRREPGPLKIQVEVVPERFRLRAYDPVAGAAIAGARFFVSSEREHQLDELGRFTELPSSAPGVLDAANPFPGASRGVLVVADGFQARFVAMDRDPGGVADVALERDLPAHLQVFQGGTAPATGVEVEWLVSRPALGLGAELARRRGEVQVTGRGWTDAAGQLELALPADLGSVQLSFSALRHGAVVREVRRVPAAGLRPGRAWTWQLAPELVSVELELLDHAGKPVPGIRVSADLGLVPPFDDFSAALARRTAGVRPGTPDRVSTGADGVARLRLEAGAQVSWSLELGDPDGASFNLSPTGRDLLPPGGSFRRTLRTALGSRSVTGTLLFDDGTPVPAGLALDLRAPSSAAEPGMERVTLALTAAQGSFTLSGLPDIPLQLSVLDGAETLATFELGPADTHPVFKLPPLGKLTVRPQDPMTGAGFVGDVRCDLYLDGGLAFHLRGRTGESLVFDQLPRGDGWLSVWSSPEGVPVLLPVTAGTDQIDAVLVQGRRVSVPVGLPGRRLPEDLRCYLVGEELDNPGWRLRRELDGNGSLVLHGAPTGPFQIVLRDPNGEPIGEPIQVPG